MILLVTGLALVVIVILIAAFLSVRLGRGDDREEPAAKTGGSRHDRRGAGDPRWREQREQDGARGTRRPPPGGRPADRGTGQRPSREREQSRDRLPYGGSRHERERTGAPSGYDYSQQRGGRYNDETSPREYSRGTAAAAHGARAGQVRGSSRQAASGRGRREEFPSYDSGPVGRTPPDDFPSGDFPSGDFPSGDFPSGDFPSGDFPSGDFPSGEFPSGEFPSGEFPSGAQSPPRREPARAGASGRERPESRHKSAKLPPSSKRGRQHRGKRDEDDWPSTEWDKLSDEQYWAEVSADKPLSTTARTAPTHIDPKTTAPAATASPAEQARPKPVPPQPGGTPAGRPAGDTGRRSGRRAGHGSAQEALTERLPVRTRQQQESPAGTGRETAPSGPADAPARPGSDPRLAVLTNLAGATPQPPPADDDPLTSPSFSRRATRMTDSRSYSTMRKNPQAGPESHTRHGETRGAGDAYAGTGNEADRTYPPGDYAAPGYGYQAPEPAPTAWYSAPAGQTHAQGDHYDAAPGQVPSAYPSSPSPGYPGSTGGPGYTGYPSEPAGGYPAPGYEAAAPGFTPYPGIPSGGGVPGQAADASSPYAYPGGYPDQAGYVTGQPGQAPYPEAYGNTAYPPGYAAGYEEAHPYQPDGYEGYPPQA